MRVFIFTFNCMLLSSALLENRGICDRYMERVRKLWYSADTCGVHGLHHQGSCFSDVQDTHPRGVNSSSCPVLITTSTPLSTEWGTNMAKSRTRMTSNVSRSRFPPSLQKSFFENLAIMTSVSSQSFTYDMRSSGSTFSWMMKVIRDRAIGEVRRVLIMLGGSSLMHCSSMRSSVKPGQRLKLGRSFENFSSV
jgi:hypothetical protein